MLAALVTLWPARGEARSPGDGIEADVVVIVDTSRSMAEAGMDPKRASLLVTRLFADIVPGNLAVVRLLDLSHDKAALPSKPTGKQMPCAEGGGMCELVDEPEPGAWTRSIREAGDSELERYGILRRADSNSISAFKERLDLHLAQNRNNSPFLLAFAAADRVFTGWSLSDARPRTVIWLSDGRSDNPDATLSELQALEAKHVTIDALVFGEGDTALASQAGLAPITINSPADMMRAFADIFRRIVGAPYRVDDTIAASPSFEMKLAVEEAWVVIYGDESLSGATVLGPSGQRVSADHASGTGGRAGVYRVAWFADPAPGTWTIQAQGGGAGAAYAVVQRSGLLPALVSPEKALADTEVALVAVVKAGREGTDATDAELLRELRLTVEVEGRELRMVDDGSGLDAVAGDGRFTAAHRFSAVGEVPVRLHLVGAMVDRWIEDSVEVSGSFAYDGGPISLDLGMLSFADASCLPLVFFAEHQGPVSFTARVERRLPSQHELELQVRDVALRDGDSTTASPGEAWTVCLRTGDEAPSSVADGELWLSLAAAGSTDASRVVPFHLTWQVTGLGWFARWWKWLLALLLLIIAAIVAYGYISSSVFPRSAVIRLYADSDLEFGTDYPIRQYRGTGRGCYRDAMVYICGDYRIAGHSRLRLPNGAVVRLRAHRRQLRAQGVGGQALQLRTGEVEWDELSGDKEHTLRFGELYGLVGRDDFFFEVRRG
ncbi:MAG: hypothetical protein IPN01_23950 [Deltaproteobacteria bacterium]|nr:hypothetical protein [Deltaproteobacteria bacterium]